jgi:effector-binding domain-containing protein
MTGSAEPRIVELTEQPSVAVRLRQPMSELDLAAIYDRYLPLIGGRLANLGAVPAGPPYGRYHEFGPEQADVEVGFPVAGPVDLPAVTAVPGGEIGASALPAGPTAVTVHSGPYDTLKQAYDRLSAFIDGQGRSRAAGAWESYVDNPAEVADPALLRTELYWPLG